MLAPPRRVFGGANNLWNSMPTDVTSAGSLESSAEDETRDDGQPDANAAAFAQITEIIDRAGELLPAQGPITAFVFLNTLQALEDLPLRHVVDTD